MIASFNSTRNTKSPWQIHESPSRTLKSTQSPTIPVEVHELVKKLAKVDGVARVRAVAPRV
jgi:ACT domain-containing protein